MIEKRLPEVGEVIKGIGWITKIGNLEGTDKFWGDEPYMTFVCWNSAYHGMSSCVLREIDEADVCNEEERQAFFLRAQQEINEAVNWLRQDLYKVRKQLHNPQKN